MIEINILIYISSIEMDLSEMFDGLQYSMVAHWSYVVVNSYSFQVNDIVQVVELYPSILLLPHLQLTKWDLKEIIKKNL